MLNVNPLSEEMLLFGIRLVVSVLIGSVCASVAEVDSIPGGLLAVTTPDTLLKPLLNSTAVAKNEERRGVLRGLLEVRQYSCQAGWGTCDSGGCCPIGGECCSNG